MKNWLVLLLIVLVPSSVFCISTEELYEDTVSDVLLPVHDLTLEQLYEDTLPLPFYTITPIDEIYASSLE